LRTKKVKKNDLVLVKWVDAFHLDQGWLFGSANELEFDASPVWTSGFLIKEDKKGVLIAQTWFQDDCANIIGIPRGMIIEITKLGTISKEDKLETSRTSGIEPTFR